MSESVSPRRATQEELEESFRSSLNDLIVLADKLSTHCKSVGDLIGMAKLATENDGQLRLLMATVFSGNRK